MPRLTKDEFGKLLQQGKVTICTDNCKIQSVEPQRAVRNGSLGTVQGKETCKGRIRVSITVRLKRLLDPDNATGGCKFLIDAIKEAGLIKDDRLKDIILEVRQEKAETPEAIIELFYE